MLFEKIKEKLNKYLSIDWNKVEGCTTQEIQDLEEKYNVKFPLLYREFLLNMGRHSGNFLEEYFYNYNSLLDDDLHIDSKEVLLANETVIPENAFFFLCYSGYEFACFLIEENNDNPPVRFYYPRDTYLYAEYNSLYEFYLGRICFYRTDLTIKQLLNE